MSKLKSYLGLCVKSGGLVIGQDRLKKYNKTIYLLIVSPDATKNLEDLAFRLSEKFDCDCIKTNELLGEIIHISGCKFVGVTNESLANAIKLQQTEFTEVRRKDGKQ